MSFLNSATTVFLMLHFSLNTMQTKPFNLKIKVMNRKKNRMKLLSVKELVVLSAC